MAKLILKRKKTYYHLYRTPLSVLIDGKKIASIYPSQIVECDIKEGKHLIVIESKTKRIKQEIIIKKETKSVEITLSSLKSFIYLIPVIREIKFN